MGMTRPIPQAIRDKFNADPWYKKCCIADSHCDGHIQFHHNFTYAGKRTDDPEGILPACVYHHSKASVTDIKERFDLVMYLRGAIQLSVKYPKIKDSLLTRFNYVFNKYG